ncbi:copper amine oxidase N-terminal domain-containing protein [Lysinibacillus capsici]|uniref:copper amine oxidase N-terminal domain-containing protein n=1 Tax=Lysinibacillus capsici TaxID=2115968 RepID=UPI0034E4AA05
MKKLRFIITLLFCLLLGLGSNNVSASQEVSIYINGEKQSFSNQAVIENGSTLVPLRGIFESLGANVQWDQSTQTIDASKGNTKVWLKIGSKNAKVNNNAINLSIPAQVKNGKTLVPLRFISESLGANVQWNQKTQTVTITEDSNEGEIQNPKSSKSELLEVDKKEVPTLKIGETFSDDQIEVTIKKVEYVNGVNKGFNVYLSVTNKSEKPLQQAGGLQFRLIDSKYEEELNRIGYSHHFESNGYLYKGETRNGYYQYLFDGDVKIEEITFHIMDSGILEESKAKWIVE